MRTFNYYLTGIAPAKFSKENLLGNIFLFVPFGILLPVLFNKADGLFKIMMICFLISLSLETIQLATALGTFDVDDILLNTLGSMLGYGIYAVARNLMRKQQGHNSE